LQVAAVALVQFLLALVGMAAVVVPVETLTELQVQQTLVVVAEERSMKLEVLLVLVAQAAQA
jgi:hypothetical protein